ncbi:MAG: thiamine pyrophosphate-binding protein, partial [Candidatus Roizmanbacteria bacterium]|nr:thiamine pyrophosphate-binding protein [Candidatus Roizmanbacteria bacterium]
MIRLSDYVIDFLVKKGITDIFLVSGGGIMFLCDAVGKNKKIKYISNHHEQASATAAEAWARTKNHISACLVTTGPGGTNAITGVAGAWVDSIPMIILSGQVKREVITDYSKYRQVGPQEINIIPMVKPITKYAVTVMDANKIKYELEKCFYEAATGRPGPVWIDIPLDIQSANIDEKKIISFVPPKKNKNKNDLINNVKKAVKMLSESKKPILIAGQGVRLSGGQKTLEELVEKLKIPVIFPINGLDLLPENNKQVLGKFGPVGQRKGNFALQNSDLVISIGASLNTASTGYDFQGFARNAKKIMVNIDQGEIENKKITIDFSIVSDAKEFMVEMLNQIKTIKLKENKKWLSVCQYFKDKYPSINQEYFKDKKHVNSYVFFDVLSDLLKDRDVLVTGISLDACSMYQAF